VGEASSDAPGAGANADKRRLPEVIPPQDPLWRRRCTFLVTVSRASGEGEEEEYDSRNADIAAPTCHAVRVRERHPGGVSQCRASFRSI
jgi:hypothetical protein